jgi:protein-tyrosine phosphatase
MAISDLSVPPVDHLHEILALIDRCISDGSPAYVHCWGGIGRTGTVIGCWLTRHGFTGEAALEHIAKLRERTPDGYRRSPETAEQWGMVLAFAAGDASQT